MKTDLKKNHYQRKHGAVLDGELDLLHIILKCKVRFSPSNQLNDVPFHSFSNDSN